MRKIVTDSPASASLPEPAAPAGQTAASAPGAAAGANRGPGQRSGDRLHWIASQVSGETVLDIGTGDGALPLLLGREGFHAVGLDLDAGAIDHANSALAAEPETVRERVEFRHGSLFQGGLDALFDTIVLNGTLAGVSNVPNVLRLAFARLKENGRAVVATPFGAAGGRRRGEASCLGGLGALLQPYGKLEVMRIEEGDILAVLTKTAGGAEPAPLPAPQMLAETEAAALRLQAELQASRDRLRQARQEQEAELAAARQAAVHGEQAQALLERELATWQAEAQASGDKLRGLQTEVRKLSAQLQSAREEAGEARDALIRLQVEYGSGQDSAAEIRAALEAQLQDARGKEQAAVAARQASEDQSTARLAEAKAQIAALQAEIRDLKAQHVRQQESWGIREAGLQDTLGTAQAETEAAAARLAEAEAQIAALQADNRNLEAQLARHQETPAAHSEPQPATVQADSAGWRRVLDALPADLEAEAAAAASLCLQVSGAAAAADPAAACLFSSVAQRLAPGPRTDRMHGFRLLQAGLRTQAEALLAPLAETGYPGVSSGEQRRIEALLNGTGSPDAEPQLRVAAIMDDFTYTSYAPECDLLQLTPEDWQQELRDFRPQMLFIESAWRGKDEKWGPKVGHLSPEVRGIVAWCKEHQIPTVFWNKEDPVHFETFLTTAAQFDIVCTTDLDRVGAYKARLGHDRVYFLPFACQPKIHNPIETWERQDAFCFAGAYYVRYPERTRDLESFVDTLPKFRPLEIYDRNFGKDHPDYMFPDAYKPFIVGTLPPEQIDRAYKGYRFGINLNSVKNSQTMFARRVYELLGSNTATVSNYSRGLRHMFGDLVISSDNGQDILERLQSADPDKLRLAGLRKVMSEHTYGVRLNYVARKAGLAQDPCRLPPVTVVAEARTETEALSLTAHFRRQEGVDAALLLVLDSSLAYLAAALEDHNIRTVPAAEAGALPLQDASAAGAWAACMTAADYYGPNYLRDLLLAARYSQAAVFCKAAHYRYEDGQVLLAGDGQAYRPAEAAALRRALLAPHLLQGQSLAQLLDSLPGASIPAEGVQILAIDPYNYCQDGSLPDGSPYPGVASAVDDLAGLDCGYPLADLEQRAETCRPAVAAATTAPGIAAAELMETVRAPADGSVAWEEETGGLLLTSNLPDGKHVYLYQPGEHAVTDVSRNGQLRLHLEANPGLNLQCAALFLDKDKQRLGHVMAPMNKNTRADLPEGTAWVRFGLRIYSGGQAVVKRLLLDERAPQPVPVLSKARHLVLTNHYPSWEDIYRNGFVHSRVKAYREQGEAVDVFRLRPGRDLAFHEFEGVDCMTGSRQQLNAMLPQGLYDTVLVHFLDEDMWQVLEPHVRRGLRVVVWLHGSEVQPWHRRAFNYQTKAELEAAKAASSKRLDFWRRVLADIPPSLHLVFVSQYLRNAVEEDLQLRLPAASTSIVHNPIKCDLFSYNGKDAEQRCKILSIRPFASRTYANDLTVRAILTLKDKPFFNNLEFRLVGRGPLFEETVAPVRDFKNVILEQAFLTQPEIARLHKDYGIFLCPSRMDSQGVSRDEAMASGLVPVTTDVAAIPEFVDESCGFLAPPEDAAGLAAAIETLYHDPARFQQMSGAAAARVRRQSGGDLIVEQELRLFATRQDQEETPGHDAGLAAR
ncbi:glycosyltransferase [Cribrihabitans neustonicus]|uniref:glycosyltransferase n=1 Tax=Cribrihabitans neustonicus TaxID=1429085 RepID=UPI003B5A8B2A